MADRTDRPPKATAGLLSAALSGLLCLTVAGCAPSPSQRTPLGDGGTVPSTGAPVDGDTPMPSTACATGVYSDPQVTSSTTGALTEEQFQSKCMAENGIFEVQPHCGGSNSCRGMSYDSETMTLSQHTCRFTNSCAGYTCVVCDD